MVDYLPLGSREQAIKGAIKGALLNDKSAASVYDKITGTALGIRESEFYKLAAQVKEDVKVIQSLWELDRASVITTDYTLSAKPRKDVVYSFKAHVEAFDINGISLGEMYKTATSSSYMTKEEVIHKIESLSASPNAEEQYYQVFDVVEAYYHA